MSYPSFRDDLRTARRNVKQRVLSWQREYVQAVRQGQEVEKKINPHLAMYVHITNLHTLFEFCIPCIQDYGVALKGNNLEFSCSAMIDCCFSSSVVGVRVLGTTIARCWCVVSSCNTGSRKISPLHSY